MLNSFQLAFILIFLSLFMFCLGIMIDNFILLSDPNTLRKMLAKAEMKAKYKSELKDLEKQERYTKTRELPP